MPAITNFQQRTYEIVREFFKDIDGFTADDYFERVKLLRRTKQFFNDISKLDIEQFTKVFTDVNFSSIDIKQHEKYREVLYCLVGLVLEKYSQLDLLRYFLPESLSEKETRPEYASHLWRITHWFNLIGYWLRQLRDKPNYGLTQEHSHLADSIKYIKDSFKQKIGYIANHIDNDFKQHLLLLVKEIEKKSIYFNSNEMNHPDLSVSEQAYHQALVKKGQELQAAETALQKAKNNLVVRERKVSSWEQSLEGREEGYRKCEEGYREKMELFSEEREEVKRKEKSFEVEKDELKGKISTLMIKLHEQRSYISYLEQSNLDLETDNKTLEEENKDLAQRSGRPRFTSLY